MRGRGAAPVHLLPGSERRRLAQHHWSCAVLSSAPQRRERLNPPLMPTLCATSGTTAATVPTTVADIPPLSAPKCVGLQQGTAAHPWQPDPQQLQGGKGCLMGPAAVLGMGMGRSWADPLCAANFNLHVYSREVWEALLQITYHVCTHTKKKKKKTQKTYKQKLK